MKTHLIINKKNRNILFVGTYEDCEKWLCDQKDDIIYEIVGMSKEELISYNN